ncbi:MAG: transcriptional repressor NrdR [Clostridiaceae bacterium]|jgi:transcriptional repressor NrdR|nr:transcriptional regulator NrdR [Bacillota bacterium]NLN52317.1 transcriptional repressor NrdR [Clostridiaceae bacterium]
MKCPFCGHAEDKVNDSRQIDDGETIRRRRECLNCKQRFTTYERVEKINLFVIKQDGSRQQFDREKLIQGILKSSAKRPVTLEQIESIVNQIENQNSNLLRKEITSTEIGEQVMAQLKNIDEVAYIRFASVYKDFDDLQSFINELHYIMDEDE